MEYIQTVPRTDLARKTRQVLNAVQRGQTAIVESHGQPEAVIMDIVDYRILRAATRYYYHLPEIDPAAGLTDEAAAALDDPQERCYQVLAHYLGKSISLGRAAELLEIPWVDLRMRLTRLDVPVLVGPSNIQELEEELENIRRWESEHEISSSSR